MNFTIVFFVLGWILKFEAAFLCLPAVVGLIYGETRTALVYLAVAVLSLVVGCIFSIRKPTEQNLYAREGFVTVALSWIVMSIFGALPFVLAGDIPSYVDALFETISGFTTTGASILKEVEPLSHTSLFWRSFTHWIGGMGVFIFMIAIMPMMGGRTMNLMKAESPGPSVGKLVPHIKDSAKLLYLIYIFITIVEIILLCINGMPLFDSLCSTFGTVGTGGFGIKNDSFASYSPTLQIIVTIFMILSGVNYSVYFMIYMRKFRKAFQFEEVKWYFGIIAASILVITINISHGIATLGKSLLDSSFQVASIITTTGFATTDFDLWPQLSKTILIILMFIGACAGSTGGGMKVSRIIILFKTIRKELRTMVHPRLVKKITMDGHCIPHEVVRSTNVFTAVYFVILFASVLFIGIDEFDFTTNFTAVAATLNNIGPGMELVGPTGNYGMFSIPAKLILMFDMLAGRLELFPMLLLFTPMSWRK